MSGSRGAEDGSDVTAFDNDDDGFLLPDPISVEEVVDPESEISDADVRLEEGDDVSAGDAEDNGTIGFGVMKPEFIALEIRSKSMQWS